MVQTKSPTTSTALIAGPRHAETIAWLAEQSDLLLAYEGEWVAFTDRRLIAHGPSVIDVVAEARAAGVDDPLLVPVPSSDPILA